MTVKAPITETLGSRTDHADTVAQGPDPGRPFLRKWNISNRSGYDGSQYCTGDEPFLY